MSRQSAGSGAVLVISMVGTRRAYKGLRPLRKPLSHQSGGEL
jgi:hypothetical protein